MAEKKASLTVLGGPLAGTRFVLEGVGGDVLLGAEASCQFQLALAGVSAQHARIHSEPDGAFSIEDAGSEHGLHVNDSRVAGPVPLRNGDIVWLGTPGEADVVMLQCILPPRSAASPAPAPAAPEPSLSEDETLALALESEAAPARTEIIEAGQAPTGFYTPDDAAAASGAPFAADAADAAPVPFASAEDNDLVVAEDETVAERAPFAVDAVPPPPAPPHFEDDTREQTFELEEDQSTVVMAGPDVQEPAAVYATETGFMDEEAATVVMGSEPEPSVALAPPRSAAPEPPTELLARVPAAPAPPAPAAPAAPPATRTATPPASPRPARPSPPAPSPAPPAAAPRRPAPRPQSSALPRPEAEGAETAPGTGRSSAPLVLYAGLGVAALAAAGGGYWAFTKFRGAPSPATAIEAPPTTVAAAPPAPRAVATAEPVDETPVQVRPEATPLPAEPPPAAATSPAAPPTTLRAAPSPLPSPSAPAKKAAPTPTPVATPAGPSPEQVRAQQVATLLGQADAALASGQYDQAIGHFDEVLRLDPGNGKAQGDRTSAVALREAAKKKFVAGRTVVKTEKASGGLAGFEGADVQRTPDFSGRLEFEMSPASGLKAGDAWTMKFFLVNDGKKAIKIGGVTATTNVNGTGAGGPVAGSVKEVAPQQRVQLGQLTGSWKEGTTAWTAEVLVTANKGDSLKNTLTWR